MHATGFDDTIRHFLGYLHLADAVARTDVLFDGSAQRTITLDVIAVPPPPGKPDLEVEATGARGVSLRPDAAVADEMHDQRQLAEALEDDSHHAAVGQVARATVPNINGLAPP